MSRQGRAARLREAGTVTDDKQAAEAGVAVRWEHLSPAEQAALMRLNRGHCQDVDKGAVARLIGLGLAVLRPSGVGISRIGRELTIARLLGADAAQ